VHHPTPHGPATEVCVRYTAALAFATMVFVHASTASAQQSGAAVPQVDDTAQVAPHLHGPLHAAVRQAAIRVATTPQTASGQASHWFVRHPVLAGTLIGAGGGLALSRVDTIGGRNHDPRVALIGAGAGAWSGLVASAVRDARAGKRVGTGTRIGIAVGAVGLVVLPVLACYGAGGCGGTS
jgi:hypothetical protein